MANSTIDLIDLDGFVTGTVTATYTGLKDDDVTFESDLNEGLDRETEIVFRTTKGYPTITETRNLYQEGLREKFTDDDFMVADGGTFHVLKLDYGTQITVDFSMSDALRATLILPFDQELPNGLTAYRIVDFDENNQVIIDDATTYIKANTPYLINGTSESIGSYQFTGISKAIRDRYTSGVMVGTYRYLSVLNGDFRQDGTEYVLQNHEDEGLAYYPITEASTALELDAYHCYIDKTLAK